MKKHLIIVAGGSGLRMQTAVPKQFIEISGVPILMHTIMSFFNFDKEINIVLALPKEHFEFWKKLCIKHNFTIKHQIIEGGETRFNSVKNALNTIENSGLVAIHDAVRPFVSSDLISRCFETAQKLGNAIPAIEIVESLREISETGNKTIDRNKIRAIQTPQTFKTEIIKLAFEKASHNKFTDDASVLENIGEKINLIEGEKNNIKITTQQDLNFANYLLNNK
jgi:2-C-methyl-D-erythritol 4-phosphate cytidylyltransferase